MPLLQLLPVVFALAICVAPVLLLRRSEQPVGTPILRNAWIASGLRLSALVALFGLAATGDIWPAIIGVAGFAAGLCALAPLRRRLAATAGRGSTLAAQVALACGGGDRIRLVAACLVAAGLLGLACAETAALAIIVKPIVGGGLGTLFPILLVAAGLLAVAAGPDRMRFIAQALLGAILIGLFGAALCLLYLTTASLPALPPHGAFALATLATACVAIVAYRQTKYIETPHLVAGETVGWRRRLGRQVRLLQRFVNIAISVLAVTVVVIAVMVAYVLGLPDIAGDAVAALATAPQAPSIGLLGIAVLAFCFPLIDAVAWQSADAIEEAGDIRRPLRLVAAETAILGMLIFALGTLAILSTELPPESTGIADLVRQLVAFEHPLTETALALLLVACFAMATAVTGMAVTAAATVIRQDVEPALVGRGGAARSAWVRALGLLIVIGALWIAAGGPSADALDVRFHALLVASACLPLGLLPLLAARALGVVPVGSGRGLIAIAGGVLAGLGCVAIQAVTGEATWLWLAAPACLAATALLLAFGVLTGRRPAS